MIVIPAIDVRAGRTVRLVRGRPEEETVYGRDPVRTAAAFAERGATWLHVVDLDAALGTGDNRAVLRRLIAGAGARVQAGGGLHSLDDAAEVLEAGAARVVLGTEAVADPRFLVDAVERFGRRVVAALDTDGRRVLVRGWRTAAGALEEVIRTVEAAGAPRFLLTAVSRDGTLEGPDLELYRRVRSLTGCPLIASGGVRTVGDLRALAEIGVEGAVVGKALYEGTLDLREALALAGGGPR